MTVAERLENKRESNRRCMKKRILEGKNIKGSQQTKDYQEMRANDYPGYSVYYIPEEHYIGMSKNVYSRMIKHNHLGKIIDRWEVIESFENPIRAHLMETQFHLMGYNGYRPLMGSGSKKKGGIDMGSYSCKVSEYDAREWGIRNGIYISPFAKNSTEWYISININGKTSTSPAAYEKIEIWKQIYKYYLYYYSKYTKQEMKKEPEVIKKKTIKRQQTTNSADNPTLF